MVDLDDDDDFTYVIKSAYSDSEEFLKVEKEYWNKSHSEDPDSKILKILIDGRNTSNTLIKYMVEEGKRLIRRHKIKEALMIIFYLDTHTDEELQDLEKTVNPNQFLTKIIKIKPNIEY